VSADATSGTVASDVSGNTVTWDGGLPSGGSVTVTIHATLTDDPGLPGAADPTAFVVVSPTMHFSLPALTGSSRWSASATSRRRLAPSP
jgi:hypothetical protein